MIQQFELHLLCIQLQYSTVQYQALEYLVLVPSIKRRKNCNAIKLNFLERNHVHTLDVVLKAFNCILQVICAHLIVFNDQIDLQLLDTESNINKLGFAPQQAILINASNCCLHSSHIGVCFPWLDINGKG